VVHMLRLSLPPSFDDSIWRSKSHEASHYAYFYG
jgi:hypothetical protein